MEKTGIHPADLTRLVDLVQGDGQAWGELVALFQATSQEQMTRLAACVALGDREGMRKQAHALKGSLATVGAMPALATIEALSRAATLGEGHSELCALAALLEAQVGAVWAYLDQQTLASLHA